MSDFLISECIFHGAYAEHLEECPTCERLGLAMQNNEAVIVSAPIITKSKQKGNKVQADGHTFDSETEYKRYQVLRLKANSISNLEVHPSFELLPAIPKLQSAITYTADFAYFLPISGRYIVEDVKGTYGNSERNRKRGLAGKAIVSPESRLRHKMLIAKLYAKYGAMFEFRIVTNVYE